MEKLNVLVVPAWYPSHKNPVEGIFVKEQARAIGLFDNVAVLYADGTTPVSGKPYAILDSYEDGIRTLRVQYRNARLSKLAAVFHLWAMLAAARQLAATGFRPDVVHAHVFSAGLPALLIGKRYRSPVVVTEHSSQVLRDMLPPKAKRRARLVYEHADIVCPVSKSLRMYIQSFAKQAAFRVVPNVADTSLFFASRGAMEKRRKKDPFQLLFVGSLRIIKGLPYLLTALAAVKKRHSVVLDIVGEGPNRREYETLTERFAIADIVRFHGLRSKAEVATFMKKADVLVLPSLFENLPCVLVEAMASGLPVIATKVGGVDEIVGGNRGIVVPAGDVQALQSAIERMIDRLDEYGGEASARYAQKRFSHEAVGRALHEIHASLTQPKA